MKHLSYILFLSSLLISKIPAMDDQYPDLQSFIETAATIIPSSTTPINQLPFFWQPTFLTPRTAPLTTIAAAGIAGAASVAAILLLSKGLAALSLSNSVRQRSIWRMRLALYAGADVHFQDDLGRTPIFLTDRPDTMALLLARGADPNAQDLAGQSPLFYFNNPQLIRLLLDHGANPYLPDVAGVTALTINYENIRHAIVTELEDTGEIIGPKFSYLKLGDGLPIMDTHYRNIFTILKKEQNNVKSHISSLPNEIISMISRQVIIDQIGVMDQNVAIQVETLWAQRYKKTRKFQRIKKAHAEEADFLNRYQKMLPHKRKSGILY